MSLCWLPEYWRCTTKNAGAHCRCCLWVWKLHQKLSLKITPKWRNLCSRLSRAAWWRLWRTVRIRKIIPLCKQNRGEYLDSSLEFPGPCDEWFRLFRCLMHYHCGCTVQAKLSTDWITSVSRAGARFIDTSRRQGTCWSNSNGNKSFYRISRWANGVMQEAGILFSN